MLVCSLLIKSRNRLVCDIMHTPAAHAAYVLRVADSVKIVASAHSHVLTCFDRKKKCFECLAVNSVSDFFCFECILLIRFLSIKTHEAAFHWEYPLQQLIQDREVGGLYPGWAGGLLSHSP